MQRKAWAVYMAAGMMLPGLCGECGAAQRAAYKSGNIGPVAVSRRSQKKEESRFCGCEVTCYRKTAEGSVSKQTVYRPPNYTRPFCELLYEQMKASGAPGCWFSNNEKC